MADSSFLDNIDLTALQKYLAGAAKSSAEGNVAEGNYLNARDRIAAELYGTQSSAAGRANQLALDSAKYTNSLPNQGFGEAVRGSLLQNMQDVTPNYGGPLGTITSFSGGARPSALGPEARAAGGSLASHGSALLADPGSFAPTAAPALAPPSLSPEPAAGFWGKAAGASATTAGILSALTGGSKPGAASGGDLKKLIDMFRHKGPAFDPNDYGRDPNGNYGEPDPFYPDDDGRDPNMQYGPPDGQVDTSTEFNGLAGGYPDNPEDPTSRAVNWWDQLPLTDQSGGAVDPADGYGPDPSDTWGG